MIKILLIKNKWLSIIISLTLLIIIAYFDVITGNVIVSLFYLIPILIITWTINYYWGILFALVSSSLWFIMAKMSERIYINYSTPYWNALTSFSFFVIISFSIYKIKELLNKEKRISKLNSDMLSAVSHEFNNLLTGIHLSSYLLEEDEGKNIKAKRIKLYNMQHQNYSAMKEQINTFLNKARFESGKIKPFLQRAEIGDLIDKTINLLLPLTLNQELTIVKKFPINIISVKCDIDLMNLAVSNLISNAIKYSPKDKDIYVSIKQIKEDEVEISVEDNGIGIKKKEFNKIFGDFYRTTDGKDQAKGFGIGLRLTRDILKLHNSTLQLKSEKGKGSKFYFNLPIYK